VANNAKQQKYRNLYPAKDFAPTLIELPQATNESENFFK
jgi:hypothetical protein